MKKEIYEKELKNAINMECYYIPSTLSNLCNNKCKFNFNDLNINFEISYEKDVEVEEYDDCLETYLYSTTTKKCNFESAEYVVIRFEINEIPVEESYLLTENIKDIAKNIISIACEYTANIME